MNGLIAITTTVALLLAAAATRAAESERRHIPPDPPQHPLHDMSNGKDDPANAIGAGLADSEIGLRLRYEIRRELAPYVGLVWTRSYGKTEDLARAAGHDTDDLQFVAGLRVWF